jgi:hypothetical protein
MIESGDFGRRFYFVSDARKRLFAAFIRLS